MKTPLTLLGGLLACGMSVSVLAQTCVANATYPPSATMTAVLNLCTATDQLIKTCADGTSLANGPDMIFSFTQGPQTRLVFTVNGTGFNPYIALMSGATCKSADPCGAYENTGPAGSNISLPDTNGLPAGQYWLVVTDATANFTCPGATFVVSTTGTPVQLQSFEID